MKAWLRNHPVPCGMVLGCLALGLLKILETVLCIGIFMWVDGGPLEPIPVITSVAMSWSFSAFAWGAFAGRVAGEAARLWRQGYTTRARELCARYGKWIAALNGLWCLGSALYIIGEDYTSSSASLRDAVEMLIFWPATNTPFQAGVLLLLASSVLPRSVEGSVQVTENLRL